MCLIITGPSKTIRSTLLNSWELMYSIYAFNSDGLGLMYRNKRGLKTIRTLPKTLNDFERVIQQMPDDDRQMALHARYTTHGDTDISNCHPYTVVNGSLALMHNGVLDTGNAADKAKSDTWHFVQDYLVDLVTKHPGLVNDPAFKEMLGEFIGNNRFVFMDDQGRMSIINEDQGVHAKGLWFSNTYAWDAGLLIKGYRSHALTHYSGGLSWDREDEAAYDAWWRDRSHSTKADTTGSVPAAPGTAVTPTATSIWDAQRQKDFVDAVYDADQDTVRRMLEDFGMRPLRELFKDYRIVEASVTDAEHLGATHLAIASALIAQDESRLLDALARAPEVVADVLMYFVDLMPLDPDFDDEEMIPEPDPVGQLARQPAASIHFKGNNAVIYYCGYQVTLLEAEADTWDFMIQDRKGETVHGGTEYSALGNAKAAAMNWITAHGLVQEAA